MWSRLRQTWNGLGSKYPLVKPTAAALIWLPTAVVFTKSFYSIKSVSGRSMQPTLNPHGSAWRDIVLFDHYSISSGKWERGDVVAVWSPVDPDRLLVKRIVAVAGDTVQTLSPYPDASVVIPDGHVWVEGDERFRSDDSNLFGPVPCGLLTSKLVFILWPLERIGPMRTPAIPKSNVPHGPAWRQAMAALEQEGWRRSRVTVPEGRCSGDQ